MMCCQHRFTTLPCSVKCWYCIIWEIPLCSQSVWGSCRQITVEQKSLKKCIPSSLFSCSLPFFFFFVLLYWFTGSQSRGRYKSEGSQNRFIQQKKKKKKIHSFTGSHIKKVWGPLFLLISISLVYISSYELITQYQYIRVPPSCTCKSKGNLDVDEIKHEMHTYIQHTHNATHALLCSEYRKLWLMMWMWRSWCYLCNCVQTLPDCFDGLCV